MRIAPWIRKYKVLSLMGFGFVSTSSVISNEYYKRVIKDAHKLEIYLRGEKDETQSRIDTCLLINKRQTDFIQKLILKINKEP